MISLSRFDHNQLCRYFRESVSIPAPHPHPRRAKNAIGCSELELERQLNRARTADLVQRIEAAIRTARTETARQRLR